MPAPIIRANWGSMPIVQRVLSYDESAGYASVLFRYCDGATATDTVPLRELEALDNLTSRKFVDLKSALKRRAEHLIGVA
jgi:hypothetical protein